MKEIINITRNEHGAFNGEMALVSEDGATKIAWVNHGEGANGKFNPEDPDDVNYLRFEISRLDTEDQWTLLGDGSYCTRVPATESDNILIGALHLLLEKVDEVDLDFAPQRQILAELAWVDPSWI